MAVEMCATGVFEYDRFIALAGSELCAYMEPLVIDPEVRISKDVLDRLLSELPDYDEYHLVYALQLGADHSLDTFLSCIPEYLAHERDSVCCTAFNILNRLRDEYITQDLIDSVGRVLSSRTVRKFVAELLDNLQSRRPENGDRKTG